MLLSQSVVDSVVNETRRRRSKNNLNDKKQPQQQPYLWLSSPRIDQILRKTKCSRRMSYILWPLWELKVLNAPVCSPPIFGLIFIFLNFLIPWHIWTYASVFLVNSLSDCHMKCCCWIYCAADIYFHLSATRTLTIVWLIDHIKKTKTFTQKVLPPHQSSQPKIEWRA